MEVYHIFWQYITVYYSTLQHL